MASMRSSASSTGSSCPPSAGWPGSARGCAGWTRPGSWRSCPRCGSASCRTRRPSGSATAAGCTRPWAACGIPGAAGRPRAIARPSCRPATCGRPPARTRECPARARRRSPRASADPGTGPAATGTGPARWPRRRRARSGRRRTASRPGSGSGPRRSRSTRSAGRPRCADSRRCTSRPCRSASCSRSSCTGSRRCTCASPGTCPDPPARCRRPRACR